jgi:hypothetical protein
MCNLYSMTRNQDAIRAPVQGDERQCGRSRSYARRIRQGPAYYRHALFAIVITAAVRAATFFGIQLVTSFH